MKRALKAVLIFSLLATVLPAISSETGVKLKGWNNPDPVFWKVEGDTLVGQNDPEKKGSMLYTEGAYSNFIFSAEVRWSGEIDSGVMFRKPELQLQIGVSRSLKKDMTGSYYTGGKDAYPASGRATGAPAVLKPGDWNLFKIEANGDQFTCWINGTKVSNYSDPRFKAPGPIGLQIHPGLTMKVEFRNIKVKATDGSLD